MHETDFLPIICAAIAILVIGCWNPVELQMRDDKDVPSGYPSYIALAIISFIVGATCSLIIDSSKHGELW